MSETTIQACQSAIQRMDLLLQWRPEYLLAYWNPKLACFHTDQEAKDQERVSVTNTCFGLFSLMEDPGLLAKVADSLGTDEEHALQKVGCTLLGAPWKSEDLPEYNMYTTPIVLAALAKVAKDPRGRNAVAALLGDGSTGAGKVRAGYDRTLETIEHAGAVSFGTYPPSAYLSYWAHVALDGWASLAPPTPTSDALMKRVRDGSKRLAQWAEAEVFRQMAFHAAGDTASFDSTQLAYAVSLHLRDLSKEEKRANTRLMSSAVESVLADQSLDGLWRKSHPIFHYSTRGSVYTFTFEMLDVLLDCWELAPELRGPELGKLLASLSWAEENRTTGGELRGWRSNHLYLEGGPEAWSTAAVFAAVGKMERLLRRDLNEGALTELRATRFAKPDDAWDRDLYDSEVRGVSPTSLKALLRKHLVDPHLNPDAQRKNYSAVFFGLPGTAKTTLAERIARALGWPYIYLQTSDFAGEGVSRVVANARAVFNKLAMLEKAVVLFDEVEEFVLNRKHEKVEANSRMITTSMLSFIQDLRRKKGVVFIVATNCIDKIDEAITRPCGRFDLLIPVGPPSQAEKKRMFRDALEGERVPPACLDTACAEFNGFVDDKFEELVQRFTYPEWRSIVDEVATGVAEGRECVGALADAAVSKRKDGFSSSKVATDGPAFRCKVMPAQGLRARYPRMHIRPVTQECPRAREQHPGTAVAQS